MASEMEMNEQNTEIPSLVSLCRLAIAKNLERFSPHSFRSLTESEWDSIVKVKYKLTEPKVKSQKMANNTGRKKPMITEKDITEIELHNTQLRKSKTSDALIWRDCVNFRFRLEGPSRPLLFQMPWTNQVNRIQVLSNELSLLMKKPSDGEIDEDVASQRTHKLRTYVRVMLGSPMCIPLLSETGCGKSLKKFIKACKNYGDGLPEWFPDVHVIHDTNNPDLRGKSLLVQLGSIFNSWKELASSSGAGTCSGKHRNTSDEQHLCDLEEIQKCSGWRELFKALSKREQSAIKTRGAKMRKIREDLESDRHKIQATKTKQVGNRRLGARLLNGDASPKKASNVSKLGKLRQSSVAQSARLAGKSKQTVSGFGCSVASSSGQKRKVQATSSGGGVYASKKNKRVFALGKGKKMKLPNSRRK